MLHSAQEALLRWTPARWAISTFMLGRGALRLGRGALYRAMLDYCWVLRVGQVPSVGDRARPVLQAQIETLKREPANALRQSFLQDEAAMQVARVYSLAGGTHDLFRDLIVLKAAREGEKGVILLKYARTFDGVAALCDLDRLMDRYDFVLEPCWAGYCHPSTLIYVRPGHPVFVQCFTDEDYDFVAAVGAPLVPLRLGPADWVNAELFRPKEPAAPKTHDLVMVANWSPQKRHALLFKALRQVQRDLRVLLIGFPWADRTAADVRAEVAAIGNPRVHVDILEQVPQAELAGLVGACKAFVFLNRKEGDNKALVEAMFADVPAIVYAGLAVLIPDELGRNEILPTYAEYYFFITAAIVVFTAFVAPEVLCTDRRTGMLGLYLASPLTRTTYLAAKATAVLGVLAIVTLGPPLFLLLAYVLVGSGPDGPADVALFAVRIVVAGTLLSAFFGSLSMAVSSVTDRKAVASAAIAILLLLSAVVTGSLVSGAGASPYLLLGDLFGLPFEAVVRIFGEPYEVKAEIKVLPAFSAHADRNELIDYVRQVAPRRTFLVHGEPDARAGLASALQAAGLGEVRQPMPGDAFDL